MGEKYNFYRTALAMEDIYSTPCITINGTSIQSELSDFCGD